MKKEIDLEGLSGKMLLSHNALILILCPLLSEGKRVRFRIKGSSMFPLLKDGRDSVVLGSIHNIEKGDVVLAQISSTQSVLHRVIAKEGERLVLMGDGNLRGIEQCSSSDVIGKVERMICRGRSISTQNHLYRFYTVVWLRIMPLKKYICAVNQFIKGHDETMG